jgi:hypothetical protein
MLVREHLLNHYRDFSLRMHPAVSQFRSMRVGRLKRLTKLYVSTGEDLGELPESFGSSNCSEIT